MMACFARVHWFSILTTIGILVSLFGAYTAVVIEIDHIQTDHATFKQHLAEMEQHQIELANRIVIMERSRR